MPPADATPRQLPRRAALPPELSCIEQHHEPDSAICTGAGCGCALKRIGEDVSEKLDYTPGPVAIKEVVA